MVYNHSRHTACEHGLTVREHTVTGATAAAVQAMRPLVSVLFGYCTFALAGASSYQSHLEGGSSSGGSSPPQKPVAAHGTTPVMGWSTWYAYGGDLNETKILHTAELMVSTGLVEAGYIYLNLDDAWLAPTRDRFGRMMGDPGRFPSGIKSLVAKVNKLGIKLGLYGDPGIRTCMGYPGQFEHEYQDAQTLAEWGVEFWKYDQCWHKFPLVDILAVEAYSGKLPSSTQLSNGVALGLNVRGMSAVGQDADFAGERIANFTGAPEFVGPKIEMAALPASWERAETWNGASNEGGIPGTQVQYYESYRLFGEALAATGKNITYSICPFIAGCDRSIWTYYADVAHMSMNQCPEHDATDSWASFLWHIDDAMRNGVGEAARPGYFNDLGERVFPCTSPSRRVH